MDDLKLFTKCEPAIESLVQSVLIFSNDIKRDFGLSKRVMMMMFIWQVVKWGRQRNLGPSIYTWEYLRQMELTIML